MALAKVEERKQAVCPDGHGDLRVGCVMPALVGWKLQDAQDVLQSMGSFLLTQTDATGMERFQMVDSGWKVSTRSLPPDCGSTSPRWSTWAR